MPAAQISELMQAAIRHYQNGSLDAARQSCSQVIERIPKQPDALHLLAVISAQSGSFDEANRWFGAAIAAAPQRADFHGNFANALWEQGRPQDALDYSSRALALDARRPEFHNIQGNTLLSLERPQEAAQSFRQALALLPDFPHALNNLGNALQKLQQYDEAVTAYRRAISLNPDYAEAYNNLAMAYRARGEITEAAACFRKALELRPGFRKAASALAEVSPQWQEPLDGHHLQLRRYREDDAAFLAECFRNTGFMALYNQYLPRSLGTTNLAAKLRDAAAKHPYQTQSVDWIIVRKQSDKRIGIANLTEINFQHRRAEFLIGIPDPAEQTTGAGLEASLLVLDFAFNRVDLHKITNIVYADNPAAQKNTLALGFVAEGYQREHICDPDNGRYHDIHFNGMTVGDFRSNGRIAKLSRRLIGRDITLTPA